ncbi:MAG: hypothetical protein ABMA64_09065 [Myxococcota bacterium]
MWLVTWLACEKVETETLDSGPSSETDTDTDTDTDSDADSDTDTDTDTDADSDADSGVPAPTDTAVAACTEVGGVCWYLGDAGASCTDTCAAHGGYDEATRTYAGSDGTLDQCYEVLDALAAGSFSFGDTTNGPGLGCYVEFGDRVRTTFPTDEGATFFGVARACACAG